MTTMKGRTAFNRKGTKVVPNEFGPPDTAFKGRGALPAGKMTKRYPGAVADTGDSNRRHAKAKVGDGGGCATVFKSRTGFGSGK